MTMTASMTPAMALNTRPKPNTQINVSRIRNATTCISYSVELLAAVRRHQTREPSSYGETEVAGQNRLEEIREREHSELVVPEVRIELTTRGLQIRCSATELLRHMRLQ